MLARVRWLEPRGEKSGWTEARLFVGTAESPARVRPVALDASAPIASTGTAEEIVEIVAARPVAVTRGDRLVLRRLSPATTLGGGTVLDPVWRRPKIAGRRQRVDALAGTSANAAVAWLAEAGVRGLLPHDLARRWGSAFEPASEFLRREVTEGRAIALAVGRETRFVAPATLQTLATRATTLLTRRLTSDQVASGIPRAEFLQRLLPGASIDLAEAHLRALVGLGVAVADGDLLRAPGARPPQDDENSKLAEAIALAFDRAGLQPPSPGEVRQALSAKAQILEGLIVSLIRRGRLVRLSSGLVLSAKAVDQLEADLRATGWESFNVAQFKERFGLTRKWAIPLLEQLDGRRATRRVGEERRILPPRTGPPPTGGDR